MAGWIKLHRKIIYSDIYAMPPLYLRVFERLLLEANHKDVEIPFKYSGEDITSKKLIKRGERQTSIRQICEWVGWYENGIWKNPNPKTIKEILDWLVANKMIEIYPRQSNKDGTHYKIVKYNDYQKQDDEEVTVKKQSSNNKETVTGSKQECIKNDKNDKEDIYILSNDEKQFLEVLQQIKNYPLDREKDLEMYKTLGERYPQLDLLESIETWRLYKLDKPLAKKSNARSQINNSFKKYVEWGKCLKKEDNDGANRNRNRENETEAERLRKIAIEEGLITDDLADIEVDF